MIGIWNHIYLWCTKNDCSFDLLSKSECKADRSKTIKMGGVKVKMLQMGGRLPRWSKCEEPKKPSGSKREGCKCAWKWEGGNIKVKILKMGGGVLKMGGGVRGQQCCKVDTWVMLGAATQVRNCFLTQSGFPLQNYHGASTQYIVLGSVLAIPHQARFPAWLKVVRLVNLIMLVSY